MDILCFLESPAALYAERRYLPGDIKVAIMALPSSAAQQVAEMLVESGIKAILNYAPINISVPGEVQVQYIDPAAHLQHMTYYLE